MESVGLISRLIMGLLLPFKLLFDGRFAARVAQLSASGSDDLADDDGSAALRKQLTAEISSLKERADAAEGARDEALASAATQDEHAAALHLLAILQRDGRLVDFLTEDVASFSDAEVGGAARLVHDGCKKVLKEYFTLEPIRSEEEGANITVEKGFDPALLRLTGNVTGQPPHKGALAHPGWRVVEVNLPALPEGTDPRIIAAAEVEL